MPTKHRLVPAALVLCAVILAILTLVGTRPDASQAGPRSQAAASPEAHAPDAASPPDSSDSPAKSARAPVAPAGPIHPVAAAGIAAAAPPASPGVPTHALPSSGVQPPGISAAAAAANPAAPILDAASRPAWPAGFTFYRTPAEILAGKDLSDPLQRAQAVAEMSEAEEVRYEAVLAKAAQMGIPARIEGPGHRVRVLYDIREEGPLYRTTLNTNAAISTGANLLNQAPYGLNGQGMTVGVWDAARARTNHVELAGKVTIKDGTSANDDHSTHVAGTIAAKGVDPKAKGMGTNTLIHSYDWNNDYAEMTAAGAATATNTSKIPISNHSYGYGAASADMGRYEDEAVSTDTIAYQLPHYLVFWAAGNEQTDLPGLGGYQSITFVGLAKNVVTVGAADDAVTAGVRDPSKATLAYFSSMGPCDDGRIKPDVVANGVNVYSCVATSTNSYDGTYSGTSMATPNAAGSAALLQQLYRTNFSGQFLRASMLKGLLIHTADDRGRPGPDYQYGWGLVNVKAAADVILAHKASLAAPKMIEGTVTATNKVQTHSFTWDGTNAFRATLVWTDPAGAAQTATNSRTRNLVNDLDLKVTAPDGTTAYLPYVMPFVGVWTTNSMTNNATTGTNKVDNVERVDIPAPSQPGTYTVTVGMYGTNVLSTNQVYSLIVTGGANVAANPPPAVALDSPANGAAVLPSTPVNLTATATDQTAAGGAGLVAKVEFLNGTNVINEDATAPYAFSWTPPGSGTYSISARATDSEGAVATSAAAVLTVLTGDGTPSISSFTPSSGISGASVVITGANFAGITAVRFNGVDAAGFTVDSPTQITATVPAAAATGPITVVTALGTATSASNFTVDVLPVTISQIYGAGGNTGATFNADYVELHNRSGSAVNLTGWSVQYASASGTTWSVASLSGSIAPGGYFLVRLAGGPNGTPLPAHDSVAQTVNMSGTSGKVALRNTATAFTGSSPAGQAGLQDLVGYGSANSSETAPAPSPSTTTAIFRAAGGATDTGNNAADFTVSTPNPRNSSFGGGSAPVITSPLTAAATVGTSFNYQIAASNSPTSYNAVGLPGGLAVNTSTGLVSGAPTIAGTYNVTISATNASGSDSKTLVITVNPAGGGGGGALLFSEDFASITTGNNTNTGGSSSAWAGNTNFPTVSTAFQAGGAVRLSSSSGAGSITSRALDLSGSGGGFSVSFKVKGWTTYEGPVTVTVSGLTPQVVTYSAVMSGAFESKTLNFTGGTTNATLKFQTASGQRAFIDDVVVTAAALAPAISTSGTLTNVHTVYGTASTNPASFTLSGSNMTAGILVTPPPGFEVSQTAGGGSGYAPTQTVGAAGTISNTPVFVRLAAGTTAGQYSGNVVCSSAGASSVNVAVPPSNVNPKNLVITANDQLKPFGQVLTLGPGQAAFTANGLVLAQTVGSVTLAASGGAAANDATGAYELIPSDATGGTFLPSNYSIDYVSGVLTVTGQTYGSWSAGLPDPAPAADPERDGLPNLVEYYMSLDPSLSDSSPAAILQGGVLTLDYRRGKNTAGVSGRVQWHPNLTDPTPWTTNGVSDQFLSDHGTYEMRRATVPVPPGEPARFLRLEVTEP